MCPSLWTSSIAALPPGVGAAADDGVMGSRRRRQRLVEQARAVPLVGHQGCGCSGMVRLVYRASCRACGRAWDGEVVLPSSGGVGDERPVYASCECGAEASGVGRIVELLN
jgi:hypothetical protein